MNFSDDSTTDIDFLRHGALTAAPAQNHSLTTVVETVEDDKDVLFARESIRTAMAIGLDTLRNVNDLAKSTDDPKVYRVVSSLIASISDAAETLLKTKNPAPKINPEDGSKASAPAAVNLYFEGTPGDIQRKRRDGKRSNIIDGDLEDGDNE